MTTIQIDEKVLFKYTKNEIGNYHSYNDDPAIEYLDGSIKIWYDNGLIHRINNPAMIRKHYSGDIINEFYNFGKLHSYNDKPAITGNNLSDFYENGTKLIFKKLTPNNLYELLIKNYDLIHKFNFLEVYTRYGSCSSEIFRFLYYAEGNVIEFRDYTYDITFINQRMNSIKYIKKIYNGYNDYNMKQFEIDGDVDDEFYYLSIVYDEIKKNIHIHKNNNEHIVLNSTNIYIKDTKRRSRYYCIKDDKSPFNINNDITFKNNKNNFIESDDGFYVDLTGLNFICDFCKCIHSTDLLVLNKN